MKYYVVITAPTIGKREPVASKDLAPKDKVNLKRRLKARNKKSHCRCQDRVGKSHFKDSRVFRWDNMGV